MKISLVSFNIRCKSDRDGHSVAERAPRIEKVVRDADADLICLQEYTPPWEGEIADRFCDYDSFVKYRDERDDVEASPILWRRERFELVKSEYFWLSDTPEVKSRGWDTDCDCCRMCVAVTLRERKTGEKLAVMNTHFGLALACHLKSAELVMSRAERYAHLPLVIAGDFNTLPSETAYAALADRYADVSSADKGGTFNDYGRKNERIDYIFANSRVRANDFYIDRRTFDGKYASDHYALCAKLAVSD